MQWHALQYGCVDWDNEEGGCGVRAVYNTAAGLCVCWPEHDHSHETAHLNAGTCGDQRARARPLWSLELDTASSRKKVSKYNSSGYSGSREGGVRRNSLPQDSGLRGVSTYCNASKTDGFGFSTARPFHGFHDCKDYMLVSIGL